MKPFHAFKLLLVAFLLGGTAWGQSFSGTCKGTISQSDGVHHPVNGMNAKNVMKLARDSQRKLGSDGYLWSTKEVVCNSIAVTPEGSVSFGSLTLAGARGGSPYFTIDSVKFDDGSTIHLPRGDMNGRVCQFFFADQGTFISGWEARLTGAQCELRMKTSAGELISVKVSFQRQ